MIEWRDFEDKLIDIQPNKQLIKNWDTKLYGGQQFERMVNAA